MADVQLVEIKSPIWLGTCIFFGMLIGSILLSMIIFLFYVLCGGLFLSMF